MIEFWSPAINADRQVSWIAMGSETSMKKQTPPDPDPPHQPGGWGGGYGPRLRRVLRESSIQYNIVSGFDFSR